MKTIEDLKFEIKQLKAIIREQARQLNSTGITSDLLCKTSPKP